jgi:hypothetical protein
LLFLLLIGRHSPSTDLLIMDSNAQPILSVCLSAYLSVCLFFVSLLVYPSVSLSICPFVGASLNLPACLSVRPSVRPFVLLYAFLSVLSVFSLSVCLYVYLSFSLPGFLSNGRLLALRINIRRLWKRQTL